MPSKYLATLLVVATLAIAAVAFGSEAQLATARFATGMHEAFNRMSGEHIHRATLTPDNTTAEDNTTAAGGSAVTYTFVGGERLCYEAVTTDAYVEVIAAASMTAGGAKGRLVKADQAGDVVCDTFRRENTTRKVSALCSAAGPCTVKVFEVR